MDNLPLSPRSEVRLASTAMKPLDPLARMIGAEVRGLFAPDEAGGDSFEPGIGLFPADAVSRRVHGDVTCMMVGGVSALLLQMLHPGALAGVWDHSNFRNDMQGRLRRTGRFIGATTYGRQEDADRYIDRVLAVHGDVRGKRPDGTPYSAFDPHLVTWVHVSELQSFLAAWKRYREPAMPREEEDRYFAENVVVAKRLGGRDIPASRREVDAFLAEIRPELVVDHRVREVRSALMTHRSDSLLARPADTLFMRAGIDLLPEWAQRMHGLRLLPGEAFGVRAAVSAISRTVGWALESTRPPATERMRG